MDKVAIKDRIKGLIKTGVNMDDDSIDKLIYIAYYMGREEAAREVSDEYADLICNQRERARQCRYKHMAMRVVGDIKYIYNSDYASDITEMFGDDLTGF